jgi:hypothetical protein
MRYFVLMCALLAGCVAPPITITQGAREASKREVDKVERVIVMVYHHEVVKPSQMTMAPTAAPLLSNASVSAVVSSECPRFKRPRYTNLPSVPVIDPSRSDDYQHIAEVLLDHVEALIQHAADVKRRSAVAYNQYVQACELNVD